MTKGLKLSIAAAALLAVNAFAGTVNTVPHTIAKEYIDGTASGALNVGLHIMTVQNLVDTVATNNNLTGYSPTTIDAISLANGTVTLAASSGSLAIGGNVAAGNRKLAIIERNVNNAGDAKVVSLYANTYAGKLSFASDAAVSYTNGKSYELATVATNVLVGDLVPVADLQAIADNNIILSGVAQGTTSVNFKIELWSTDTQALRDSATNTLVLAQRQVTASVTTKANNVIDSDTAFTLFTNTSTVDEASNAEDTIKVSVNAANLDTDAVGANDTVTIKLTADKPLPATMLATYTNTDVDAAACTISNDRMTVTCTDIGTQAFTPQLVADSAIEYNINLKQTGGNLAAMANSAFTAQVGYDFQRDPAYIDYVLDVNPAMNADAGAWTYSGATLKVPYLVNSTAAASFSRITNESGQTAKVYVDMFDEAGEKVSGVMLGEIAPHASALYLATDMVAAAKAAGASATFASANSGRFSAVFLVTAPAANVYGTAVVK